jgi:hypothetical protein
MLIVPVAVIRLRDFKSQSSHRCSVAVGCSKTDGSGGGLSQGPLSLQCVAIAIICQSGSPMVGG